LQDTIIQASAGNVRADQPVSVSSIFARIASGRADAADYRSYIELWTVLRAAQARTRPGDAAPLPAPRAASRRAASTRATGGAGRASRQTSPTGSRP